MDLYFQRHDGSAVTCDDFLAAMADANGEDLSLMSRCVKEPWFDDSRGRLVTRVKGPDQSALLALCWPPLSGLPEVSDEFFGIKPLGRDARGWMRAVDATSRSARWR